MTSIKCEETAVRGESAEQCARFALHELLATEQQYVEDLSRGLERYGRIFEDQTTLPIGLQGKQQVLLANVAQISALHRHEVLPLMLQHQQHLEKLFDRWRELLERGLFYCYVVFTASQRASLLLYDTNEPYFKHLQIKLGDPLGIRSFLLKPVQRIAKYPLLLSKFIEAFYNNREVISKRLFEVACRLEFRLRELLDTANQSDLLNDINHFNAFNILCANNFITVGEFLVNDVTLRRNYSCKLFVFNTCLIHAEVTGKKLLYRGKFIVPDVSFNAKSRSFVLCNKQRECEFSCNPGTIQKWEAIVRQLLERYAMVTRCTSNSDPTEKAISKVDYESAATLPVEQTTDADAWLFVEQDVSRRTTWYTES
ncbi:rho guanine nucleotide exchange factor 25-like [Scaptodrosophila lebanonensis]|uniref:Rho guanine nucleotide exchange factor 25-like n=1 Tax=Drosophila lebanonensis TaxID=7225 RepID=A0A6J2U5S1_DROLE|nr:rho guanine nucleotide exchange factor 25-like [Scaptodrosophila lebanonensis]